MTQIALKHIQFYRFIKKTKGRFDNTYKPRNSVERSSKEVNISSRKSLSQSRRKSKYNQRKINNVKPCRRYTEQFLKITKKKHYMSFN
jgi:hypothetical protein